MNIVVFELIYVRDRFAPTLFSPFAFCLFVSDPLFRVKLFILEFWIARMTAMFVHCPYRTITVSDNDFAVKRDFIEVRKQKPIIVQFRPILNRNVSLWVQPFLFGCGDIASRTPLQDVIDTKHFLFLKFTTELCI